jgi:hypothetical protein
MRQHTPRRLCPRVALVLLLLGSWPVYPAVAQTTGLPAAPAPARGRELQFRVGLAHAGSSAGNVWALTSGAGLDWGNSAAHAYARVADLGDDAVSLRSAFGLLLSTKVHPGSKSWRVRGFAGAGRSLLASAGIARLIQVDVPAGIVVAWVPALPPLQGALWAAPRIQYRNGSSGGGSFDQVGGGFSLGVDVTFADRHRRRNHGFGAWIMLDVLRIGGDGLRGRTEAQGALGASIRFQSLGSRGG